MPLLYHRGRRVAAPAIFAVRLEACRPHDLPIRIALRRHPLARVYGLPGPMMRLIVVISSAIMVGAIVVDLALFR